MESFGSVGIIPGRTHWAIFGLKWSQYDGGIGSSLIGLRGLMESRAFMHNPMHLSGTPFDLQQS